MLASRGEVTLPRSQDPQIEAEARKALLVSSDIVECQAFLIVRLRRRVIAQMERDGTEKHYCVGTSLRIVDDKVHIERFACPRMCRLLVTEHTANTGELQQQLCSERSGTS